MCSSRIDIKLSLGKGWAKDVLLLSDNNVITHFDIPQRHPVAIVCVFLLSCHFPTLLVRYMNILWHFLLGIYSTRRLNNTTLPLLQMMMLMVDIWLSLESLLKNEWMSCRQHKLCCIVCSFALSLVQHLYSIPCREHLLLSCCVACAP